MVGVSDGSASTEIGTGRYAGGWVDGRPHGRGTMEWDNGVSYEGEWLDGKPVHEYDLQARRRAL